VHYPLAVVSTNGANSFQLQLTGQPGRLYAIDTSTNLQISSWTPLVTNTSVGGQVTFTDTQSSSFRIVSIVAERPTERFGGLFCRGIGWLEYAAANLCRPLPLGYLMLHLWSDLP